MAGVKTEEAGVKEENHRDMMCNSESEPADAVFSDEEMEARQGEQEDDDIPLGESHQLDSVSGNL